MWTKKFWKDTAEQVLTATLAAFLGTVVGTNAASEVNWKVVAWTTGTTAAGALVKCLLASSKGDPTSASLVK